MTFPSRTDQVTLFLRGAVRLSACHVRPRGPEEEGDAPFVFVGQFFLEPGKHYPMTEVRNPFDPEGGAPWIAVFDPAHNLPECGLAQGDMVGFNKMAILQVPKRILQLIGRTPVSVPAPALLRK